MQQVLHMNSYWLLRGGYKYSRLSVGLVKLLVSRAVQIIQTHILWCFGNMPNFHFSLSIRTAWLGSSEPATALIGAMLLLRMELLRTSATFMHWWPRSGTCTNDETVGMVVQPVGYVTFKRGDVSASFFDLKWYKCCPNIVCVVEALQLLRSYLLAVIKFKDETSKTVKNICSLMSCCEIIGDYVHAKGHICSF